MLTSLLDVVVSLFVYCMKEWTGERASKSDDEIGSWEHRRSSLNFFIHGIVFNFSFLSLNVFFRRSPEWLLFCSFLRVYITHITSLMTESIDFKSKSFGWKSFVLNKYNINIFFRIDFFFTSIRFFRARVIDITSIILLWQMIFFF